MIGLNIFRAIGDFFTNSAFSLYDFFREISNSENWWAANAFNVILFLIGAVFFIYWYGQLIKFNKNGTEEYTK